MGKAKGKGSAGGVAQGEQGEATLPEEILGGEGGGEVGGDGGGDGGGEGGEAAGEAAAKQVEAGAATSGQVENAKAEQAETQSRKSRAKRIAEIDAELGTLDASAPMNAFAEKSMRLKKDHEAAHKAMEAERGEMDKQRVVVQKESDAIEDRIAALKAEKVRLQE